MHFERVDRIAFRLTCRELGALLKLMGLTELPGIQVTVEEPDEATVLSLTESGAVIGCGESTLVDGTLSMVIRTAAVSDCYLVAETPASRVAIYRSKRLCVLAEEFGNVVTLEPLQDLETARGPFQAAVGKQGDDLTLSLVNGDITDRRAGGADTLAALYAALA